MSERYEKLKTSAETLYAIGSPLVILTTALLKDTYNNDIIALIKFQSIDNRNIIAVFADFDTKDISGSILNEVTNFQYLDLNIERTESFGTKTIVNLPDTNTRQVTVNVKRVIFSDNTIWEASSATEWNPIVTRPLIESLENEDFVEQYKRDTVLSAEFVPEKILDLRVCACGVLNRVEENYCCVCGLEKEKAFTALDKERLQANLDKHNEKMRIEAEAMVVKRKKRNKLIIIFSVAVLAIVLAISIPWAVITNIANNERAAIIKENFVDKSFRYTDVTNNDYYSSYKAGYKSTCETVYTFKSDSNVEKIYTYESLYNSEWRIKVEDVYNTSTTTHNYSVKISLFGKVTLVIDKYSVFDTELDSSDNPIYLTEGEDKYQIVNLN